MSALSPFAQNISPFKGQGNVPLTLPSTPISKKHTLDPKTKVHNYICIPPSLNRTFGSSGQKHAREAQLPQAYNIKKADKKEQNRYRQAFRQKRFLQFIAKSLQIFAGSLQDVANSLHGLAVSLQSVAVAIAGRQEQNPPYEAGMSF